MARKSEIRGAALAALNSLTAAAQAGSEQEGAGHLADALAKLTEAAGLAEPGKGAEKLREAATSREAPGGDLLTRLGVCDGDVELRERDFSTAERVAMAKQGRALPVKNASGQVVHGRYPIESRQDVENAVHDADRSGAGRKVKRHLIRNAKRVGASDLIPSSWGDGKARESAPLTLRERAAVGEISLLEALDPESREDPRTSLLDRLGLDADEYVS